MSSSLATGARSPLVVGEEADYLYVAKPSGIPVFPPHAEPSGDSLLGRLLTQGVIGEFVSEQVRWPSGFEGGLLHRLDTWTSGLVVVARTQSALKRGRAAFSSHTLEKSYRFLTDREVSWTQHVVDHALAHDPKRKSRMVWRRGQNTAHRGKWYPAETRFRRLGDRGGLYLWEAVMKTGVMHQIRLHAAVAGLPLLGDRLYGGTALPGERGRFFLHHQSLEGWPGNPPSIPCPDAWPSSVPSSSVDDEPGDAP